MATTVGLSLIFINTFFSSSYEDLDIDIALKNKTGESYDSNTTIYVIVYGVKGHQNEVSGLVWDSAFSLENNALKLKAKIDMNDHDIINVDNLFMNNFINMNDNQVKKTWGMVMKMVMLSMSSS